MASFCSISLTLLLFFKPLTHHTDCLCIIYRIILLVDIQRGLYFSAIPVSQDMTLRQSIRKSVMELLFTVQKALPLFQDGDGGSIILIASVGGSKADPAMSVYGATKALFDRSLAPGRSS